MANPMVGMSGPQRVMQRLNTAPATGYAPDQHTAFAAAQQRAPQGLNMAPATAYQRPQMPGQGNVGPFRNPGAPQATEVPGAGRIVS